MLCNRMLSYNLNMKMTVFWDVAQCSLVEVYRRFRGACCLHHQALLILYAFITSLMSTKCPSQIEFYNHAHAYALLIKPRN
jgi:hypothetical protein